MFSEPIDIPIQKIESPILKEHEISLSIKRDDLIHPEISGNKWRKLKYNLLKAQSLQKRFLITLGGAFSNHIAATAALGKIYNIRTKGIIRGDEFKSLNPTLKKAKANGMEFEFVSRAYYAQRNEDWFKHEILERYPNGYFIPEGGANFMGLQGCTEILPEVNSDFDVFCVCAGTGTTAAGIVQGISAKQKLCVFPAMKGGDFIRDEIEKQLYWATLNENDVSEELKKIELITEYHFGGYAKHNDELISFMQTFYELHRIKLDPIYTAKMMMGLFDLIGKGHFAKGTKIIALHSGGLQGIAGIEEQLGKKLYS